MNIQKKIRFSLGMLVWVLSSCTLLVDFDQKAQLCGNGKIDDGEDCGEGSLSLDPPNCGTVTARCVDCRWVCPEQLCGNGQIDEGEACDGELFSENDCGPGSYAVCEPDCQMYTCQSYCGNGQIDDGEACDGELFGEVNIGCDVGFYAVCSPECQINCISYCGNGTIEIEFGETCDGANLGDKICRDAGYFGGSLACSDICKVDSGNCMNAAMAGTPQTERAADIAVDRNGSVYVLGTTDADVFFGKPKITPSLGADIIVIKWNSDGVFQWAKRLNEHRADDQAVALVVDNSSSDSYGEPYIYGVATVTGDLQGVTDTSKNIYVFKMNSQGEIEKDYYIRTKDGVGLNKDDMAASIRLGSSGALYVTGYGDGGLPEQNNTGGMDGIIAKLNKNTLDPLWIKMLGSAMDDKIFDVVERSDGSLRVGMQSQTSTTNQQILIQSLQGNGGTITDETVTLYEGTDASGVSMDLNPGTGDVYVAVNFQDDDGNNMFSIFNVGRTVLLRQYDSPSFMEARRVRFMNGRVTVLGNATGEIVSGVVPQGNSMVFVGVFNETDLQQDGSFQTFDSISPDEAAGIAFDMNRAICMAATSSKPFLSMQQQTDVSNVVLDPSDNFNLNVWCNVWFLP